MDYSKIDYSRFIKNEEWRLSKGFTIQVYKMAWIPLFKLTSDNYGYIYLDIRVIKDIFWLVKKLETENIEFHFCWPGFANPSLVSDIDVIDRNIECVLFSFLKKDFYYSYKKSEFDIVANLHKYCVDNNRLSILKEKYDELLKVSNERWYDRFKQEYVYNIERDIREDFTSLYREFRLLSILG